MSKRMAELFDADIRSQLTSLLAAQPHLTPEDAMLQITRELLKHNPFVPPEGDNCPFNRLPAELVSHIFEVGMQMEHETKKLGDEDDGYDELETDDEVDSDTDMDEDEEEEEKATDIVDDDGNSDDWSDVSESPKTSKRKFDDEDDSDDDEDEDDEDEDTALPFQVLVSHVCRRWRAIALDTPSLWTLIEFEKGTLLDKHKAYIERAGSAPIDLLIDCTFDSFEDEEEMVAENELRDSELIKCLKKSVDRSDSTLPVLFGDPNWHTRSDQAAVNDELDPESLADADHYTITEFSEILDLIIPRVKYWRALAVSVSDYRWMYLLLARLHQCGPAESLRVFELYHYDSNDSGDVFQPRHLATNFIPFQGQAPRVQDCALWGVHVDWNACLGILGGLEDLEMAYHTEEVRPMFKTLSAILNSSPEINTLTLCLSGPFGTEDDWRNAGEQAIQLLSLKNLVLRYHSPEYASSLLRFLDVPNVKGLAIDFDEQDYSELAKDLCKAPHGRSKSLLSGLEDLKISGLPCTRSLADRILGQLVNVKSLNLNCTGEGEMFFEALHKSSLTSSSSLSGQIYCPLLQTITTAGLSGKQMKEFVEARKRAGVAIKKVFMSENDDVDRGCERWLKEHVDEFEYFEPSDSEEEVSDDELSDY